MRLTIPSVAWIVAILIGLSLSGDDSNGTDQSAESVSDEVSELLGQEVADGVYCIPSGVLEPYPLDQVVDVQMMNVSIRELGNWIRERFDVPVVYLPDDEYDGADWPEEVLVNAHGDMQCVDAVVRRALKGSSDGVERVCVVRDGTVVFAAVHTAIEQERVVHYDVSDLLDGPFDVHSLIKVLHEATDAEWMQTDGVGGSIDHLRGVLIVRQNDMGHMELGRILAILRHPRVPVLRIGFNVELEIERRLRQPITMALNEVPFDEALSYFSSIAHVPVQIQERDFRKNGFALDVPISVVADGLAAESVLESLIESYANRFNNPERDQLEWHHDSGEIAIGIPGVSVAQDAIALFDISDFVQTEDDVAFVKRLLLEQSSADWMEYDGKGGSILELGTGWLLIRNTPRALDEIQDTLALWRSLGMNDPARSAFPAASDEPDGPFIRTERYLMHADTAADLLSDIPRRFSPGTWRDADHPDAIGNISIVRLGLAEYTPAPYLQKKAEPAEEAEIAPEAAANDPETADGSTDEAAEGVPAETIEFPAALLIIQHDHEVTAEVFDELFKLTPSSWNTYLGESRVQIPIQYIPGVGMGGGSGGGGFSSGGGFFQVK